MLNLMWNPHSVVAPDYAMDCFILACQPFINNFNLSYKEATWHLTAIWHRQTTIERQEWDFLPFTDTQILVIPPILSSPLTLWKLHKGEYCKLYFFTNKELDDAQTTSHASMKENSWEKTLGMHKWYQDPDKISKHALIIYQATIQKRWHDILGIPYTFNLKYLNDELLSRIRSDLIHKAHTAAVIQAKEVNQWLIKALASQQRSGPVHPSTSPSYCSPNTYKHPSFPSVAQTELPHKCNKSFQAQDKHVGKTKPLPACAVCLNCIMHNVPVIECNADRTWDNKHNITDQCLYSRWKCKDKCSDKHTHTHLCSECRFSSHGAQQCS
ncbi:hypothetical protein V8B97DRAFT_2026537 [Scleroderma yunnanense]